MAINTRWFNAEKSIIHLEFGPGWRWADLYTAIQEADDLITSVLHPVHLLIDLRQAGGVPRDFMQAAGDIFASGEARPNEGERFVIGAGPLLRAAYGGLRRVYGHKLAERPFTFVNNEQEALLKLTADNLPDSMG